MSIGEPLFGVHQHFLLFFRGPMNSYELGYAVFCISEPEEGVHRNKIIILIFFKKNVKYSEKMNKILKHIIKIMKTFY